jgi:hypothetical protein
MANCYRCGASLPKEIFRTTTCESCDADAHVCRNCEFYEPGAHWDCRETIPEAVHDKERSNFCDYFRQLKAERGGDGSRSKSDDARNRLDQLFGNQ